MKKALTPSEIAKALGITEKSGKIRIELDTPIFCKSKYCEFIAHAVEITENKHGKTRVVLMHYLTIGKKIVECQTYYEAFPATTKKSITNQFIKDEKINNH